MLGCLGTCRVSWCMLGGLGACLGVLVHVRVSWYMLGCRYMLGCLGTC